MTKEELLALTAQNARLRAVLQGIADFFPGAISGKVEWIFGERRLAAELQVALAESPAQSLEAVRAKEYAMREALQFVLDCGHEDVDWCGASTKESALSVCRRALEATPEQCASRLEAVRAEARKEAERGKVSSTFGDLVKGCETLSHRVESHVWDNMPMWEQRDWLIAQAELLHQQWCEKWRKTLDRESDSKAELQEALESDRINVIEGVNRLTKEIESRAWLSTGARSSYEWDDARYQQEFRDAAEAILKALEPLKKIGADLSNCPADAKRSLERMRAEAGRERAVRELRSCADSLWATAETFIDATHPGWRPALKAASERCHSRAEKIAREAK